MSYHKPSNIEMPRRLLRCLRGLDWLNDEVINIYMGLLQVCAESSLPSSCSDFPHGYTFPDVAGEDQSFETWSAWLGSAVRL